MSCTRVLAAIALLLLLATPAHSLAAGAGAHAAATGAKAGGSKKSTWKTSATSTTPAAPPKCCEGQATIRAMGLNASLSTALSIPATCPAYNSSDNATDATNDGKWRTTLDAACPAARPLCIRVKCSANFSFPNTTGPNASLIHMTVSTLVQGCNTSEGTDTLLSQAAQANFTCEDITEYVEEENATATDLALPAPASDGLSAGAIAGIVIGSVFGVGIFVFCAFSCKETGRFGGNAARADIMFQKVRLSPA